MAKVIKAYPPNFTWLKTVFPISGKQGIIYAYGDKIFNPSGGQLPGQVLAHEEEHYRRQMGMGGPGAWWDCYVNDPKFRLEEEVFAHCVEWTTYQALVTRQKDLDAYLTAMCNRLSGPLYGKLVSYSEAYKLIIGANG